MNESHESRSIEDAIELSREPTGKTYSPDYRHIRLNDGFRSGRCSSPGLPYRLDKSNDDSD